MELKCATCPYSAERGGVTYCHHVLVRKAGPPVMRQPEDWCSLHPVAVEIADITQRRLREP